MPAVLVNMATVLLGGLLGILFRNRLSERVQTAIITALGLCTAVIGVSSAVKTADMLCVIVCMACGSVLGELLRIDEGIERAGDAVKKRVTRGAEGESRFTEGFVSACILFCVGPMTIMGSLEAGVSHDYSLIFAKSILDFISAMAFSAAMGVGVLFSALFILLFQGGLTLLSGALGAVFSAAAVNEMSAVGGTILLGMAVNMLGLGRERVRVANMLPAVFLPLAYLPLRAWLGALLG